MCWTLFVLLCFFFSSRRRHTRFKCDWSSDVCSSDLSGARGGTVSVCQKEYCAGLGVATAFDGNDHAIAHAGLRAENSFQVLGKDVETGGSDDHVFLAAAETQIAFGIEFAQIARAQPAFLFGGPNGSLLPIAAGNVFAANEDS